MNEKKTWLFAWNGKSRSAKLLASKLGIRRIRLMNSKYKAKRDHVVINWGSSELPPHVTGAGTILNPPDLVRKVSVKSLSLELLEELEIPHIEWTTDAGVASGWLEDGYLVVVRETERGHGGTGILILDPTMDDEVPEGAPLYTRYFPKKSEWRVHVSSAGDVFYVQRKVLDGAINPKSNDVNWKVRNRRNGFIFQRYNNEVPAKVVQIGAALAGKLREITGGAPAIINADVLYNEKKDLAVVCELNSAPGLDNTSAEIYANKIKELV